MVLEQLDSISLTNVAEVSEDFSVLAANVFKRKFAIKMIDIRETSSRSAILERSDIIMFGNFKNTLNAFKHFGPFISKLKIIDEIHKNRVIQVLELINPEAITTIYLKSYDEFTLNSIKTPFWNAENVWLDGKFQKLGNDKWNLNELFPKVHQLSLKHLQLTDQTSIHLHFRHLRILNFAIQSERGLSDYDIECLIELNPQIQELSFESVSINTLKFVSEHVQNLESLYLKWRLKNILDYNGDAIHMNNTRKLVVNSSPDHFFRHVIFDQLEELTIHFNPDFPDDLIDIVESIPYLTKLEILKGEMNKEDLNQITGTIPNLVEVSIEAGLDIDVDTVDRFLKMSHKLETFVLNCDSNHFYTDDQLNELKMKITTEWIISQHLNYFMFERKHLDYETNM